LTFVTGFCPSPRPRHLPKSSDLNGIRQSTLAAWGEQDFEAALAWARNRESDDARKESLSTVLAGLAARDPVKALRLISDTFSFADSGQTYDRVFKVWAQHDIVAAVAAAKALKSPALRERALRVVLDRQVLTDPRGALDTMREANLGKDAMNLVFNAFERWEVPFRRQIHTGLSGSDNFERPVHRS
jgi:hypothetical protein